MYTVSTLCMVLLWRLRLDPVDRYIAQRSHHVSADPTEVDGVRAEDRGRDEELAESDVLRCSSLLVRLSLSTLGVDGGPMGP